MPDKSGGTRSPAAVSSAFGRPREMQKEDEADDTICLDESFFVNRDYDLTTFTFGSHVLNLFCLLSASTDYDLTGQLVWPGAVLLNNYLSKNAEILEGHSVIELGSGVGITGILCSRFCREVLLTDHNDEVLEIIKKNIELHLSSEPSSPALTVEKLEWGNSVQISEILQKHPGGFDLVLGADIYILFFPHFPPLIFINYMLLVLDIVQAFNSPAFLFFSIPWRSFSIFRKANVNSYWLMCLELSEWIHWLSMKLFGMECRSMKYMGPDQLLQTLKESYLRSPLTDVQDV